MDATDFSLTNAAQYFVEQKDFDQYRDAVKKPAKEVGPIDEDVMHGADVVPRIRRVTSSARWVTVVSKVECPALWACHARGTWSCCLVAAWISWPAKGEFAPLPAFCTL